MTEDTQIVYAPLWRRFAAMIYDSFIILAISMAYGAISLLIYTSIFQKENTDYTPVLDGYFFQLGWLFTIVGFYSFFWHNAGQTVGMRAWKIRIQNEKGLRPGYMTCVFRFFLSIPSLLFLGLGYFYAILDPKRRGLHDLISKTETVYQK